MSLDQLASTLDGSLVLPGSDSFDEARLFHGQPGDPAAVVRVAAVEDVVATVAAARAERLPVAVRSGGHSTWESLPGALVLDLRSLRNLAVKPPAPDGSRVRRSRPSGVARHRTAC